LQKRTDFLELILLLEFFCLKDFSSKLAETTDFVGKIVEECNVATKTPNTEFLNFEDENCHFQISTTGFALKLGIRNFSELESESFCFVLASFGIPTHSEFPTRPSRNSETLQTKIGWRCRSLQRLAHDGHVSQMCLHMVVICKTTSSFFINFFPEQSSTLLYWEFNEKQK
jgi:hypothetical protein